MKGYSFCASRMLRLKQSIGVKRTTLAKVIDVPYSTYQGLEARGDFTTEQMVTICNFLHIPIAQFVKDSDSWQENRSLDNSPVQEPLIRYQPDDWKTITWDISPLTKIISSSVSLKIDAAKKLGIGINTWYRRFEPSPGQSSTIAFSELLYQCNVFGISLTSIINDENQPIPVLDGFKETSSKELPDKDQDLRAQLQRLKRALKTRDDRIATLLAERNALSRKLDRIRNVVIDTPASSSTSATVPSSSATGSSSPAPSSRLPETESSAPSPEIEPSSPVSGGSVTFLTYEQRISAHDSFPSIAAEDTTHPEI